MLPIPVCTLQFDNRISEKEISYLRGLAIAATRGQSVLFHNHFDEDLRYSYPLVQYKRIDGRAAVVFLGDACEQIPLFLDGLREESNLGMRPTHLQIEGVRRYFGSMITGDGRHHYSFTDWLPLNGQNYSRFESIEAVSEKIEMLEGLCVGNILSMAKGLDVYLQDRISVKITDLSRPKSVRYKGTMMMSFDGAFVTNIDLPSDIGLGKGVSIGHGTITKID